VSLKEARASSRSFATGSTRSSGRGGASRSASFHSTGEAWKLAAPPWFATCRKPTPALKMVVGIAVVISVPNFIAKPSALLVWAGLEPEWPNGVKLLTDGIDTTMSDADKLLRLTQNFANIDFTYTMNTKTAKIPNLLDTGTLDEGDCQTLAKAMVKVAKDYLQIADVNAKQEMTDFMVWNGDFTIDRSHRGHNDSKTGGGTGSPEYPSDGSSD